VAYTIGLGVVVFCSEKLHNLKEPKSKFCVFQVIQFFFQSAIFLLVIGYQRGYIHLLENTQTAERLLLQGKVEYINRV